MKSKWQEQYESLPEWARSLVDGMRTFKCYGLCGKCPGSPKGDSVIFAASGDNDAIFSGLTGARDLAAALSAPWPPPPAPKREKRVVNFVEFIAEPDDCAFDQPCVFGHRVESHAIYCHNEAWPDSPRKCRRNRSDYRHEDCPGFVANPDS